MVKPMNPEVKAEWVKRLRSGEYKQGKTFLHVKENERDFYCCLGVLCEIAVDEGIVEKRLHGRAYSYSRDREAASKHDLPVSVQNWSGVQSCGDLDNSNEPMRSLSGYNDYGDMSFDDIATIIEEEL